MNLQTDAQAVPPSVDELLNAMQGQSITEGWDVICAMDATKVNNLFAQQYVLQVEDNATFFTVVQDTYQIDSQSSVEFINLVLGPPLISFNPGTNEANLQINFLSGTVNLLDKNGTTLLSQSVSTGDQFQLSGSVPLATLVGEVNNHQVVLDITNAKNFTANLGISGGTETPLGEYFLGFLQTIIKPNDPNSFNFVLGTLVYDPSGTNLTPVSFDLSTQTSGPEDDGRLLLLVQTTYSSTGGSPNWNPGNFTNIIPDGYSTTLIVSSQAVFQGIVKSTYESQFSNVGLQMQANKTQNDVYSLTSNAGQVDFGVLQTQQEVTAGVAYYWSGTYDWSRPQGRDTQHVVMPLSGIQIAIQNRSTVEISANLGWSQPWGINYPIPRTEGYQGSETLQMNASVGCSMTLSLDSAAQTVSFVGTPNINVPVPSPGGDFGTYWPGGGNQFASEIQANTNSTLAALFGVGLPEINTFAVSNLLFPNDHILNFKDVYLPGDLVIFGDIATNNLTVSPVSAIVAAGQTYQFSVTGNGQSTVTWSLKPQNPASPRGTIDSTGLYTAPKKVSKAEWIQVTAASGDQSSHAILILVPDGVLLSPDVVILPGGATQQFLASIDGNSSQAVSWTINPSSIGSIAADGVYSAPAVVSQPTAVTVTATISQGNSSFSANALVVVLGQEVTGTILASPKSINLGASQSQQFKVTNSSGGSISATPTWSVLSTMTDSGSIDASGNYKAPSTVTSSQVVVVAATVTDDITDETFVATALVYLDPPSSN